MKFAKSEIAREEAIEKVIEMAKNVKKIEKRLHKLNAKDLRQIERTINQIYVKEIRKQLNKGKSEG